MHLVKFDIQDFKAKNVKTLLRPAIWKQLMINYKNTKKDFKKFSMGSQKKKKPQKRQPITSEYWSAWFLKNDNFWKYSLRGTQCHAQTYFCTFDLVWVPGKNETWWILAPKVEFIFEYIFWTDHMVMKLSQLIDIMNHHE